ncbi:MAG: transposase [Spirochaetota bacterium]
MRQPRHLVEGAWYHVTVRVNRREMLLDRGNARDLFLVFLARAKKKYRFCVANFCVMGNHVHLLLQPDRSECLSDIMRWLLGNFAKAYNKKQGLCGHFWGDRFHSRVLEGFRHIAIVFGYIDENPVKAGLVAEASDWRYGAAWHSRMGDSGILEKRPPWCAVLDGLRSFSNRLLTIES